VVKRWEQSFEELETFNNEIQQIHDFDILEGNYIALYTGNNQTYIYEIQM